jgi:O-antigen/teichoic acid export membrane protein
MNADDTKTDALASAEVKRRAAGGVFIVGSWGVLNLVVGFAGNLVLARMLLPRDFGIVAIGMTAMLFANAISDGGLGSGLIRRTEPPTRTELRSVLALQLVFTGALAAGVAAVGSRFGEVGLLVALMMLALPIACFQTPGRVILTRDLLFRSIVAVDGVALVSYYTWSIAGVVSGYGVWALASGLVVRTAIASVGMMYVAKLGVLVPTFTGVRALGPIISFGVRFQGVYLAGVVREQGLNAGTAAIGGIGALGLWAFAKRLIEMAVLMFEPLWRVSFPLMSGLIAAKEDPAPVLERIIARSASAAGFLLVPFVVSAPELIPAVFGQQWDESVAIVQLVCLSLLVAAPISVAAVGYLYAVGAPSVVLRATIVHTAVLYAVAFPLLPIVGVAAIGIGSLAGSVVDAAILGRSISARSGANAWRPLVTPAATATFAGLLGTFVTVSGGTVVSAVAGGALALAIYVTLLFLLRRALLLDTFAIAVRAARTGLGRQPMVSRPAVD